MTKFQIWSALTLLITNGAFAGGMSSGGGEIIQDAHNPWFLENTAVVNYCIKVDAATISMDERQVGHWVGRAIQQWKRIFSDYQISHPKNAVPIATQTWVRGECSAGTDVRFQFGWGTLDPAQIDYLSQGGDPHRYIALAVRENYDLKTLHATGYIYVASDVGPNAFFKEPGQMDRPWRFPALLFAELTHELGHVFGLPHLNSELLPDSNRGVMSEYYPEVILQKWIWQVNQTELFNPSDLDYFFNPAVYWDCHPERVALDFFGAPERTPCLKYETTVRDGSLQRIRVYATDSQGGSSAELKSISLGGTGQFEFQSDITVYISPGQIVFPRTSSDSAPYVFGPGVEASQVSGSVDGTHGNREAVFIVATESSLELVANQPNGLEPISTGYPEPDTSSAMRKNRFLVR